MNTEDILYKLREMRSEWKDDAKKYVGTQVEATYLLCSYDLKDLIEEIEG